MSDIRDLKPPGGEEVNSWICQKGKDAATTPGNASTITHIFRDVGSMHRDDIAVTKIHMTIQTPTREKAID